VAHQLLLQPDYVVLHSVAPDTVTAIDSRLEAILGGNLFRTGFNFTLLPDVRRGHPEIVTPTGDVADAGPRVWLDDDGFSVSADIYLPYISANISSRRPQECAPRESSPRSVAWHCTFTNSDALAVLNHVGHLNPKVH
jgi:hypothetical protein